MERGWDGRSSGEEVSRMNNGPMAGSDGVALALERARRARRVRLMAKAARLTRKASAYAILVFIVLAILRPSCPRPGP